MISDTVRRIDAKPWKLCSCCKRAISREEWQSLKYIGVQTFEADEFGPAETLEYRNHECGSTLAVEVQQ